MWMYEFNNKQWLVPVQSSIWHEFYPYEAELSVNIVQHDQQQEPQVGLTPGKHNIHARNYAAWCNTSTLH